MRELALDGAAQFSQFFRPGYRLTVGKSKNRWKFGLQIIEGPNAGLGAGSWRVWASRNDIYVASLNTVNTIKASLHESGRWRVAYTREHVEGPAPLWNPQRDRAAWRFTPPPFVDGIQDAFVIATSRNALVPTNLERSEVVVAVKDRWDLITGVRIRVAKRDAPSPDPHDLVFPDPLLLDNGRSVWLEVFEDPTEPAPEPTPTGQIVRVLTPEVDGVACPGFLLVGFNLG